MQMTDLGRQRVSRRAMLAGLAAAGLLPAPLRAEDVVELEWRDLLPEGEPALPEELAGVVDHSAGDLASQQPPASGIRTDLNGKIVKLSGFIVPLDYEGTGVSVFMLVPYVGACIHVPPPPANQLVLVTTTDQPYESDGLFEPVTVTGMFGAAATSTQLAEIGYAISADTVEAYAG
ncbi:DUF3299 domain-containing protein [Psychromarinibacter halotolerans]|uniref:DUF3299 domain-containing protein n=1 Tax=Psychromarinibacter halotolerans TaxID=1775175 RepID=A0ABV7GZ23_9RHOB|nr:DUF3299 domain-containing protein [Psychromarinibacter halotolerans]MDF0596521.1 DUF3299 domain-containing protein [Psychromarinibacter halotolerans]